MLAVDVLSLHAITAIRAVQIALQSIASNRSDDLRIERDMLRGPIHTARRLIVQTANFQSGCPIVVEFAVVAELLGACPQRGPMGFERGQRIVASNILELWLEGCRKPDAADDSSAAPYRRRRQHGMKVKTRDQFRIASDRC